MQIRSHFGSINYVHVRAVSIHEMENNDSDECLEAHVSSSDEVLDAPRVHRRRRQSKAALTIDGTGTVVALVSGGSLDPVISLLADDIKGKHGIVSTTLPDDTEHYVWYGLMVLRWCLVDPSKPKLPEVIAVLNHGCTPKAKPRLDPIAHLQYEYVDGLELGEARVLQSEPDSALDLIGNVLTEIRRLSNEIPNAFDFVQTHGRSVAYVMQVPQCIALVILA